MDKIYNEEGRYYPLGGSRIVDEIYKDGEIVSLEEIRLLSAQMNYSKEIRYSL